MEFVGSIIGGRVIPGIVNRFADWLRRYQLNEVLGNLGDCRCEVGEWFDEQVFIGGFHKLMLGGAAAVFLVHAAFAAFVGVVVTVIHLCDPAHAVVYVHHNPAGYAEIHDG